MLKVVDTNIIIRFLVGDQEEKTKKIKKLFEDEKEKLVLTDVTVAEIVWVLSSYYKQNKEEIVEEILSLLEVTNVVSNKSLLTQALSYFLEYSIDYIDAYLVAYARVNKSTGILSFDKSIDKVKEVKRYEP